MVDGLAGSQTGAAAMNTIVEESHSQTTVLGFTVCYAVSTVLLASLGADQGRPGLGAETVTPALAVTPAMAPIKKPTR